MNFKIIGAIFYKQIKDIAKNKTVLLQYFAFPVIAFVMSMVIPDDIMKEGIVTIFASMFVIMIPLLSISNVIAEEKEKNTLLALKFAYVTPMEYIIGVGLFVFLCSFVDFWLFAFMLNVGWVAKLKFVLILLSGLLPSMILGAFLGILSKNLMSVSSFVSPISIILSMLPVLSAYNEDLHNVTKYVYSQQVSDLLTNLQSSIQIESIVIIFANLLIFLLLFIFGFRKKGLY